MKNTFICTIALLFALSGMAQATLDHPIQMVNVPVQAQEIAIFHTGDANTSALVNTLGKYDYQASNANISLSEKDSYTYLSETTSGFRSVNTLALNYDGDMYDELVQVYETNSGFGISFPDISNKNLRTDSVQGTFISSIGRTSGVDEPTLKLAKADFDLDGKDEFVVAFRNYNLGKIVLHIRNVDSSALGTTRLGLNKETDFDPLSGAWSAYEAFDLTVNDFDGDGIPDIALARMADNGGDREVILHFFKVETAPQAKDSWNIIQKDSMVLYSTKDAANNWGNVSLTSAYFDGDSNLPNQIAIASLMINEDDENKLDRRLDVIEVDRVSQAGSLTTSLLDTRTYNAYTYNYLPAQALASGDMNEDSLAEVVWARDGSFQVYDFENGQIKDKASGSAAYEEGTLFDLARNGNYLSLGDVNWDTRKEIMIATSTVNNSDFEQYINVVLFSADPNLNGLTKIGDQDFVVKNNCGFSCSYRYAAVLGEFQDGRGYLREPVRFVRKYVTPLIVNNAPPYHYDMLNGVEADINNVFPDWPVDPDKIESVYESKTSEAFTLETNLTSDWGVSGTLSAEGSVFGVGLKSSLTTTYGEEFSNTNTNGQTVSITTRSIARSDDQIYGLVQNYDFFEYPVEDEGGHKIGYVLAMMRTGTPIYQWMDSKSTDALEYSPDHEPGNILSYPSLANFESYGGVDSMVNPGTGQAKSIGTGGGLEFQMVYSDFSDFNATTTQKFGVEVSASASYFGVGAEVKGSYNSSEMSSHTSSVSSEVSFSSSLTHALNPNFSDANYTLTPRVYWSKNGALTLAYAVDPSLPSGSTSNFWSDNYTSKPDLTLILPWKYDPEKGLSLGSTPDKRRLSKSIKLSSDSYIAGDTVIITAFIQNYSFKEYVGDVEFQFYAGNPDNGGILLSDINGQSLLTITDVFGGRERTPVAFNWLVPGNISTGQPIYVVIDPSNKIDEIHDDNNVGFYGAAGSAVSVEEEVAFKDFTPSLYPNPARSRTQLELEMNQTGELTVALYDLHGRKLKNLFADHLHTGKYILPIDLVGVSPGYYIVEVRAGNNSKALKLLKTRD
ncbi:MAG: T9SS type A sorting domain-containing protein [Bacteroidota bacterium]